MIRAELLKLSTTTAAKVAAIVGILGLIMTQIVFLTVIPAITSGAIGPGLDSMDGLGVELPELGLETSAAQLSAVSPLGASSGSGSLGIAVLAVVLLGVLAGTSDYRFGGIVTTALAQPRRAMILASKVGAMALTGLVIGLAYAAVSILTLLISLQISGVELAASAAALTGVLLRGTVVVMLLALIGLAIGIIARDQLVAVLSMIGLLLFEVIVQALTQLIAGTLPLWAQLMPLTLGQAAISAVPTGDVSALPALAVLAVLVAILVAGAALALRTRDI